MNSTIIDCRVLNSKYGTWRAPFGATGNAGVEYAGVDRTMENAGASGIANQCESKSSHQTVA